MRGGFVRDDTGALVVSGVSASVEPTFAETFDTNLSAYTLVEDGNSLSVSGGRLRNTVAGGGAAQASRMTRTGVSVPDSKQMVSCIVGAQTYQFGLIAKAIDGTNYLRALLYNENNQNINSVLQLAKFDNGTGAQLAVSGNTGMLNAGDVVSLVLSVVSNQLTLALYYGHPALNPSPKVTLAHTLAGADATKFGTGVSAGVGLFINDYGTLNAWDDHVCVADVATATF